MAATIESEVLVIGGGVAGALIAARLAEAGKRIVLLEAGADLDRDEATRRWAAAPRKTPGSPFRTPEGQRHAPFPDHETDYAYASGSMPFKSTYIRRAGGSTLSWQGSAPRFVPADFRMRTQHGRGVDWPIGYDDLEPWYCRAEAELGVAGTHEEWNGFHGARRSAPFPVPAVPRTFADARFAARVDGLEVDGARVAIRSTPQARDRTCSGAASCIPICPIAAKYDATRHLDRAKAKGATLRFATVATGLVVEAGKVVGARAVSWGDGAPVELVLRAPRVVVACHAIESARLLLASGIRDRSGMIGRNLMDHPTGQLAGLSPEPWFPFRSPPVTSGIDEWRDGPFRSERSAWKLSLGNDGLGRFKAADQRVGEWLEAGRFGASLERAARDEATRWFRISWATEQLPDTANRVSLTGEKDALGVPQVQLSYRIDDYTFGSYPWIRRVVRGLFRAAGVTELAVPDPAPGPGAYGGSGHILGTTRMGQAAEDSVVDAHCRLHAHPEVRVVGSSVFPTGSTANPTLTVAALALRAAADLLSDRG